MHAVIAYRLSLAGCGRLRASAFSVSCTTRNAMNINCSVFSWRCFSVQPFAHRRSVAELCMLFKIKSNPMHPLRGALHLPHVPARVTRGALVANNHSYMPPRCRTSLYHRAFVPLLVSLWNDLSDPVFDGVGLPGFKSKANAFLSAQSVLSFVSYFLFFFFQGLVVWCRGLRIDSVLTPS